MNASYPMRRLNASPYAALLLLVLTLAPAAEAPDPYARRSWEMALIPAGEFMAGAEDFAAAEAPAHAVYLNAFFIDKFEVTQRDFTRTLGYNPSALKGDNAPANNVTWHEADTYCQRLQKRLPTEMEWEKAARGGANFFLDPREAVDGGFAWHAGNSASAPHPVGQKRPNGYGLFDIIGNVWEWVADWFDAGYYATSPAHNPKGPERGDFKSIRGGSWDSIPVFLRATARSRVYPATRFSFVGFRCAADAD